MWENTDQNNSEYGHFSRSVWFCCCFLVSLLLFLGHWFSFLQSLLLFLCLCWFSSDFIATVASLFLFYYFGFFPVWLVLLKCLFLFFSVFVFIYSAFVVAAAPFFVVSFHCLIMIFNFLGSCFLSSFTSFLVVILVFGCCASATKFFFGVINILVYAPLCLRLFDRFCWRFFGTCLSLSCNFSVINCKLGI